MQAVPDLQFLDLAQMVVQAGQTVAGGQLGADPEIAIEAQPLAALEDPPAEQVEAARVEARRLVVLVDQPLELGKLPPAPGAGEWRRQVIDDDRSHPALGLGALAGVVDDERVQVRQWPQHRLGQAAGRKGGGFSGQPLEVAVLAQMDHRVRVEPLPQPEIEGQVAMRRVEVGRVVAGVGVDVVAAGGLEADHDVAQRQKRQGEGAGHDMRVAFGLPPTRQHAPLHVRRQPGEQLVVGGERQADPDRARGPPRQLVGRAGGEPADQLGPVRRHVAQAVACTVHGPEYLDAACRHIEADPVGEPAVAARVVGQDDSDAPIRGRRLAQPDPGPRERRQPCHPVRHRPVPGQAGLGGAVARAALLERDGERADPAVDLGQGHVHRQVARAEPTRPLPPTRLAAAGENRLQHHRVGGGQRIVTGPAIERADGERGGVEHHGGPQGRDLLLDQRSARHVFQAGQVDARGVEPDIAQGLQQRVYGGQVAAVQEGAVEHQQRHRATVAVVDATVDPGPRQRHRLPPSHVAPEQRGGVAQGLAGVVEAAFDQIAPEALRRRLGQRGQLGQLRVGLAVARQAGQRYAALGAGGGDALDPVRPVAAAAEQSHDHQPRARHHLLDVEVDGEGVGELQQVGQAQAGHPGRQPRLRRREAGEVAVGRRQQHDLARRLAQVDRCLHIAAVGGQGAQQMHGRVTGPGPGS